MRVLDKLLLLLIAYMFGCLNGAYYIGRWKSALDIRELGSTNAGARNAGRVFGHLAFIYTVLIDALKTVVPLLLAQYVWHASTYLLGGIAIAVLAGHIWPLQLQFRGGKGVVVYLASALVLAPLPLVVTGLCLFIGLACRLRFTLCGLIALAAVPVSLLAMSSWLLAGLFFIMLCVVTAMHRWVTE